MFQTCRVGSAAARAFVGVCPLWSIPRRSTLRLLATASSTASADSAAPSLLASPDVKELIATMETSRAVQEAFVLSLSDNARRSISIIGASAEDASRANAAALDAVLDTADSDHDGSISRREFSEWITLQSHAGTDGGGSDAGSAGGDEEEALPPTNRQIVLLGASVSIPMIGFGFMDNFIMIIAGDAIDASIGTYFGLTMMASAALGNLVSDVMGIGLGDVVDVRRKKARTLFQPLSPINLVQVPPLFRSR